MRLNYLHKLCISILLTGMMIFAMTGSVLSQKTGSAILSGNNIVYDDVSTPASGYFDVYVEGDTLSVKGSFDNLSGTYRSAGIYYGENDENGNLLFRLSPRFQGSKNEATFVRMENAFRISSPLKQALQNGNLYISIGSSEYPRGEIRGQIEM